MRILGQGLRLALAVGALSVLAGCDQPKQRGDAKPPVQAAAAPVPAGVHESTDPLPPAPPWADAVIGKPLRALYTKDGQCIGNTDVVEMRYVGAKPGVKIIGWGWDPVAKQPVQRVVLMDRDFMIVGAGETGGERLDVPAARPNVTSKTTGWSAVTALTNGAIDTYGVLADGKTVCKLGHLSF
jgi:hypothetical protein